MTCKSHERGGNNAVDAFCDAVTALSIANADNSLWWYTWLASRDRFNSDFFDIFMGKKTRRANRGNGIWRLLKSIAAVVEGWAVARFNPVARIRHVDVLLFAPASLTSLEDSSRPYCDTYFGPLIGRLRHIGEKPLLVGIPVEFRRATIRALASRNDIPAQSIFHTLRARDIIKAGWVAYKSCFNGADVCLQDGRSSAPHIEAELRRSRSDIFTGLIIEKATRRLLSIYKSARIIHTYENNPWEHAIDLAAHNDKAYRDVIGYLHCSVLPSHLKNFKAVEEVCLRPEPDRIVCTGPAARDVFLALGAHDPSRVLAGCALRGQDLTVAVPRSAPPARISTALVLLEGLPSMIYLIQFLAKAAKSLNGRRILFRAHPVMPLETLLKEAGICLNPAGGLDESLQPDLKRAISEADAVIYQSSTAVMSAVALGVPAIKVRLPGPLEDDPLFASTALKQVVTSPQSLQEAFHHFETMTPAAFEVERDSARTYIRRYLAPANETSMGCFCAPAKISPLSA